MPRMRYVAALACALFAVFALAATAGATITTRTVEYGPWTIPAGNGDPHDHENMGMISNEIRSNVARPCTGCKLIAADPEMVDASTGREVNINTGPMLHHFVLAANGGGKRDLTCDGTPVGFLGQRFFASGNERTAIDIERLSYGYEVESSERWSMVTDLMNWSTESRRVKIKVTFKYATGSDATSRTNLRPWWLDVDGCSTDSLIEVPNGFSDTHREIRAPSAGRLIAAAGHIHDHGLNVELTNRSRSEALICNSVARSGETEAYRTPDGRSHISSMSTCVGTPVAEISSGNTLRLHVQYEVPVGHHEIDDAMGIMLAFVAP
jgi:Stress up-regulated Nod 19